MQFGLRTLIFVILLLVMPLAAYPLIFKPLNQQRDDAVHDTQVKQAQLTALAGAMAHTRDLKSEIDSLKSAISILEAKLPNEKEMDVVLQEVWEKAKINKLNIKSVRNPKEIQGANYNQQEIKMVIEGPFYPGFFKFLSDVEQMPRLTKINEMKVTADEKNNGAISADLTLTIYFESSQKMAVAK